ncbi:prepilin peptidase [Burkholderia cenocepacia]|uniref:prepilin peptidase n=1 Tax=Burkholderia cenocepacia TaxID=95486 RepID=UPI003D22DDEF
MQYAFAVVIGLCIGSFLNVVVHRLPVMMQRGRQHRQREQRALGRIGNGGQGRWRHEAQGSD